MIVEINFCWVFFKGQEADNATKRVNVSVNLVSPVRNAIVANEIFTISDPKDVNLADASSEEVYETNHIVIPRPERVSVRKTSKGKGVKSVNRDFSIWMLKMNTDARLVSATDNRPFVNPRRDIQKS